MAKKQRLPRSAPSRLRRAAMPHRFALAIRWPGVYVNGMKTVLRPRGFLDGLWRERAAFSLVALAVLLGNFFHPLAEARAANTASAWVICSTYGAVRDPAAPVAPGAADDCPMCIAGHGSCAVAAVADNGTSPTLPAVRASRLVAANEQPDAAAPASPSPAIRAPPAFS